VDHPDSLDTSKFIFPPDLKDSGMDWKIGSEPSKRCSLYKGGTYQSGEFMVQQSHSSERIDAKELSSWVKSSTLRQFEASGGSDR